MRTGSTFPFLFGLAAFLGLPTLLGPAACSSSSDSSASSATDTGITAASDAPTTPPRTPIKHRAAPSACPTTRDPGHPESSFSGCKTDGECTAGKNGRCMFTLGGGNICSYDDCVADGDCGSGGVCDCRNSVHLSANSCFHGNCRTDADCKGDFCSPSGVTTDPSCLGIPIGAFGFFCHAAVDECRDDADCKSPDPLCIFDPELLHWRCTSLACPG